VDDLRWWHTIEVAPGVVTPGGWDLRPTAARLPWPGGGSLAGLRCLDVGTFDGFWAFEMEDRGAADVVAVDLVDPARQDRPEDGRPPRPSPDRRGATFHRAAQLRGSHAEYRYRSVYDLDPQVDGRFDLVMVGYVLQLLRDPLRALAAVRGVCRGRVLVLDTVSAPLSLLPAPLARLNARRGHLEWFVFNRAGLAQAVRMAGFTIEATTPLLRDHAGPGATHLPRTVRARHTLGLLGRSLALRARP
jgi:tRNA (mo5U34)-methyltransferase